ncbi:MAG: DUF3592 domain-containing protein [Bacteroidetes bacterium]|nr:DUF3592 domain-containing protein [Bacteroidota bacterium]
MRKIYRRIWSYFRQFKDVYWSGVHNLKCKIKQLKCFTEFCSVWQKLKANPFGLFSLMVTVGATVVLLGSYAVSVGLINGSKQMLTHDWPEVSGRILSIEFVNRDGHTRFNPLEYQYVVNDLVYHSNRVIYVSTINLDDKERRSLVSGFHKNRRISVFVDPEDPTSSVLRNGVNKLSFSGVRFGIVIVGFGILWSIISWLIVKKL